MSIYFLPKCNRRLFANGSTLTDQNLFADTDYVLSASRMESIFILCILVHLSRNQYLTEFMWVRLKRKHWIQTINKYINMGYISIKKETKLWTVKYYLQSVSLVYWHASTIGEKWNVLPLQKSKGKKGRTFQISWRLWLSSGNLFSMLFSPFYLNKGETFPFF